MNRDRKLPSCVAAERHNTSMHPSFSNECNHVAPNCDLRVSGYKSLQLPHRQCLHVCINTTSAWSALPFQSDNSIWLFTTIFLLTSFDARPIKCGNGRKLAAKPESDGKKLIEWRIQLFWSGFARSKYCFIFILFASQVAGDDFDLNTIWVHTN